MHVWNVSAYADVCIKVHLVSKSAAVQTVRTYFLTLQHLPLSLFNLKCLYLCPYTEYVLVLKLEIVICCKPPAVGGALF